MKYTISKLVFISFYFIVFASCSANKQVTGNVINTDTSTLKFTAGQAINWTNLLNRKSGWFGADGIFAIPLDGVDTAGAGKDTVTMLLFSDTMLGDIVNDSLQPGYVMIHNSVALLNGIEPTDNKIHFYWDTVNGKPIGLFTPNTQHSQPGDYYWLGDGFVNKALKATYLFAYRIRDTSTAAFGFAEVGNALIKIPAGSKPPFHNQQQIETPFFFGGTADASGSFGGCIFPDTKEAGYKNADGYVYVYGVRGKKKEVLVARVKPLDFETFNKWRYWDGSSWNADITKVAGITDRASNELSVSPLPDGRYAMVFQVDGLGRNVGLRLSNHPQGPFGPIINVWECKEPNIGKNIFVYNAKVHTNLSKPNELLISYNVNSFDFWNDIKVHPDLYRPRFIRVKLLP